MLSEHLRLPSEVLAVAYTNRLYPELPPDPSLLPQKSPLATSGGGQYATSDAGSETSTSSSVTPHGIGLKSADAVAVGDLVPVSVAIDRQCCIRS